MEDLDLICAAFENEVDWEEAVSNHFEAERELIAKSNAVDDEAAPKEEQLQVLKRCFGHKIFRPMQFKIINSILDQRRDNLAIMATGYGKSLCFQYPSVYCGGITVVVSPLISLMEDQVLSLSMSNISACLLGSAQTKQREVLEEIFDNKYSLVYVTPEFLSGDLGKTILKRLYSAAALVLLAIDEAHCVSTWGHDFRHQYRELGQLRELIPTVPILAVTATATHRVRGDILTNLRLKNPQVLCSGFDRPNLHFTVKIKEKALLSNLKPLMVKEGNEFTFPGSTIIYCITRKKTQELADALSGIKCKAYHAGLAIGVRKKVHEAFVKDKINVMIATIAYGMGIDKPDIRLIIHYGTSKDLESYYQEVGRAGRDGQPSKCVLFYNMGDFVTLRKIQEAGHVTEVMRKRYEHGETIMKNYLETRDCRREFILNYFEGGDSKRKPNAKCCDNCHRKRTQVPDAERYHGVDANGCYDFTADAVSYLKAVNCLNGKFGHGMYVQFLRGSKSARMSDRYRSSPLFGSGKERSSEWWMGVGRILLREQLLRQQKVNTRSPMGVFTFSVSDKGTKFLDAVHSHPGTNTLKVVPTAEIFKLLKPKHPPLAQQSDEGYFKSMPSTSAASTPSPSTSTSATKRAQKKDAKKVQPKKNASPKLRLLKPSACDEDPANNETEAEIAERMRIFRLLTAKRAALASSMDCMPYMVASDESLMKLAQLKPTSIAEFRNCQLEGFTEAKIKRFGEELIKVLRATCHLNPIAANVKRSIQDILADHPLPGAKITAPAEVSYSMYHAGLTVPEISERRGIIASTVLSHMIDAIKAGYPVELINLNITLEVREQVVKVIRSPEINSDYTKTARIKLRLPDEITFDMVKVILAYVQVRDHLATLGIPYEDFEPLSETDGVSIEPVEPIIKKRNSPTDFSVQASVSKKCRISPDLFAVEEKPKLKHNNSEAALFEDFEDTQFADIVIPSMAKSSSVSSQLSAPRTPSSTASGSSQLSQNCFSRGPFSASKGKTFSFKRTTKSSDVSSPLSTTLTPPSTASNSSQLSQNLISGVPSSADKKKAFSFKAKTPKSAQSVITDFLNLPRASGNNASSPPSISKKDNKLPPWFKTA